MALVAVWLSALAPTVSRVTTWQLPDMGAWCEPGDTHHDGHGMQGHESGDACGYCSLFTHHPGLAAANLAAFVPRLAIDEPGATPLPRTHVPRAMLHAHPRGPPVAAHA